MLMFTNEEKTALKAVLYLAERNTKLRVGGTYIDNIKDFANSDKIEFDKAIDIVANMVCGAFYPEEQPRVAKGYVIEKDYLGNTYPKSKQVARCGNAVPPPFATALVRANLPEYCDTYILTMADLLERMAI